jgi:hypothetical protein
VPQRRPPAAASTGPASQWRVRHGPRGERPGPNGCWQVRGRRERARAAGIATGRRGCLSARRCRGPRRQAVIVGGQPCSASGASIASAPPSMPRAETVHLAGERFRHQGTADPHDRLGGDPEFVRCPSRPSRACHECNRRPRGIGAIAVATEGAPATTLLCLATTRDSECRIYGQTHQPPRRRTGDPRRSEQRRGGRGMQQGWCSHANQAAAGDALARRWASRTCPEQSISWNTFLSGSPPTNHSFCRGVAEPSDGLEPSTPSLPWKCSTN